MSISSVLGSAVNGLSVYQQALATTSNNISNVNTPGYSVESLDFSTLEGSNPNNLPVIRQYNQFLNAQVLSSTSAYNNSNTYYTMASQVDNMIADQNAGLSSSMSTFFNSINGVANNPTSIPARQVMLSDAGALAGQFNSISSTLNSLTTQVNGNLTSSVSELNGYAANIAQLNAEIVAAKNNSTGQAPNALLDQRDTLLKQITQQTNVSVVPQTDGSVNVFIGQGQPLVMGKTASTLAVQASNTDSNHLQLMLNGQDISNQISGGSLAGYLQFRDQVLNPAKQQLGLLASGLAAEVNSLQESGVDLNGNAGAPLFTFGTASVAAQVSGQYKDSNLNVSAVFVPLTSPLPAPPAAGPVKTLSANYQLQVTATSSTVNTYTLTNLSNGVSTPGLTDGPGGSLSAAAAADGFSISFSGGSLTTGDTFQISPSYNAASVIRLNPNFTNPSQIAAAGASALGTANSGDNSNALALANLQTQLLMNNGTSTFSQVYGQLVSSVGTNTSNALTNSTAQNTVLQNANASQQSVSGVNLNEEASNLIMYQNAYQACAKTVTTVQTLFTAILNAVG